MSALLCLVLLAASPPRGDEPLPTLAGGSFAVGSAVADRPALLVFWNSWLPGAGEFVGLIGEVEQAAAASGRAGVVVVFQDEPANATGVARTAPSLIWVVDRHGQLLRRFQVTRAPSIVAVEAGGKVRGRAGPAADEVRALLTSLGDR